MKGSVSSCTVPCVQSTLEERVPVWYVLDEFGSSIQHSSQPSFAMVPFYYVPRQEAYSVIWPMKDIAYGGIAHTNACTHAHTGTTHTQTHTHNTTHTKRMHTCTCTHTCTTTHTHTHTHTTPHTHAHTLMHAHMHTHTHGHTHTQENGQMHASTHAHVHLILSNTHN